MSSSAIFVPVNVVHRLAVAVRLFDIFTGETVRTPMTLAIPELRARAFRASDNTYRFQFTNRDVPSGGPFTLTIEVPSGEYESREPTQVPSLPIVVGHPPPVIRPDYLLEFPMWPTRAHKLPAAETAVVGRVISAGATDVTSLRVFLFEPPGPPPATPYAYTNGNGEFLFRLPQLHAHMSGTVPVLTATLDIEIRDAANAVVAPVVPASVVADLGRTTLFEFNVP